MLEVTCGILGILDSKSIVRLLSYIMSMDIAFTFLRSKFAEIAAFRLKIILNDSGPVLLPSLFKHRHSYDIARRILSSRSCNKIFGQVYFNKISFKRKIFILYLGIAIQVKHFIYSIIRRRIATIILHFGVEPVFGSPHLHRIHGVKVGKLQLSIGRIQRHNSCSIPQNGACNLLLWLRFGCFLFFGRSILGVYKTTHKQQAW
jgi:hypothetical protein